MGEIGIEGAQETAERCAINLLGALKGLDGDLEEFEGAASINNLESNQCRFGIVERYF